MEEVDEELVVEMENRLVIIQRDREDDTREIKEREGNSKVY